MWKWMKRMEWKRQKCKMTKWKCFKSDVSDCGRSKLRNIFGRKYNVYLVVFRRLLLLMQHKTNMWSNVEKFPEIEQSVTQLFSLFRICVINHTWSENYKNSP